MSIAAVICEYNPFHNGHKYQLDTIRKELNPDYIICLMSGDFVERGEPSIYSKELRTKWALENGADAVFQLPISFATGSADLFSEGAVTILNKLNCIDYLCFGSECGNIDELSKCADFLIKEGTIESDGIRELMKKGHTFAKARALLFPDFAEILNEPNNVLALEYLSALKKTGSSIKPYTIVRKGEGYEDDSFDESQEYLSGTAIRKAILDNEASKIASYVPYDISGIVEKPLQANDFSGELFYALLNSKSKLTNYLEMSEDLARRIEASLYEYKDFSSFIEVLKSKNYTYSRLSRALLHVMLNLEGSNTYQKETLKHLSVIKLLGFKEASKDVLSIISGNSELEIMTKIPAIYDSLNSVTRSMVDSEVFASALYNRAKGVCSHEFTKQIVVVK